MISALIKEILDRSEQSDLEISIGELVTELQTDKDIERYKIKVFNVGEDSDFGILLVTYKTKSGCEGFRKYVIKPPENKLIPFVIRKRLTKDEKVENIHCLDDKGLKQTDIALVLGVNQALVSTYLKI